MREEVKQIVGEIKAACEGGKSPEVLGRIMRKAMTTCSSPDEMLTLQAFGLLISGVGADIIRAAIEDAIHAFSDTAH